MKEFDFSTRTKFNIKHKGETYTCECPPQDVIVKFAEDCELVKDSGASLSDKTGDLLASCGLPKEIFKELEITQVSTLIEFIGAKKN